MMKISTKLSALALLAGTMMSMGAHAETQENVYDFANNNLNLEVATPADWEDATKASSAVKRFVRVTWFSRPSTVPR